MDKQEELQALGHKLIIAGFAVWFRCMFKLIEQRPFIVEPIHQDLFDEIENIINQKDLRVTMNMPPRSAKTTVSKYLLSYGLTINPSANFIYTSYSQTLLNTIATEVRDILENPIYKAMYPKEVYYETEETRPLDDFWAEYLHKENGANTYSTKKITTFKGGTCLFTSIGSQITGHGCGIRTAKNFSGALIIDDANKPADIRSQVMREKVLRYYEETLLSRLNNPHVPIINIQQRLHVEDLSGLLETKYNFKVLKKSLLDENGVCQIPSQYTDERIKELQTNNYVFQAQYQQNPIIPDGDVIKRSWFKYYSLASSYKYKRIIITADTAMKIKEASDYSVFIVGGVTDTNQLHILDMVRGKWEAPELKQKAIETFERYKYDTETGLSCSGLYIEDAMSGVALIQELKRYGVPVIPLKADKDKLTRVENVLSYIESGQVYLPDNENYGFNSDLLNECEAFTRDDSHLHDDIVDALVYNIQVGIAQTKVSILDFFLEE